MLRTEEGLRPTEDSLANLLVLTNSVGPRQLLASMSQLVPPCNHPAMNTDTEREQTEVWRATVCVKCSSLEKA